MIVFCPKFPAIRLRSMLIALLPLLLACVPERDVSSSFSLEDGGVAEEKSLASSSYQAEGRSSESGCVQATNHQGYTGPGFMDFGGTSAWLEWNNVSAALSGTYTLSLRFANGSTSPRSASIWVNGQNIGTKAFPSTTSWDAWSIASISASLRAGNNTVRVVTESMGGPNLDRMDVVATDLCPSDPAKVEPGECGCGTPEGNCGSHTYSTLVYPGSNGKLVYARDQHGNVIPDFSYAGYMRGERDIPNVPVAKTISPVQGDNWSNIQSAIDAVGNLPLVNGFRGALLLTRGEYPVGRQLILNKSGVVIRGQGSDATGTRIVATGATQYDLFLVSGAGRAWEVPFTRVKILGSYIPVGERTFTVPSHSFSVGDEVFLTRTPNQAWIAMLGMDRLQNAQDPDDFNWTPADYTMQYRRVVTAISGNRITLDAPLVDPIDQAYATGALSKFKWGARITNVGVENLRMVSRYVSETDESHGWNAITINHVQDAWVRNIESYYFGYSAVNVLANGYRISILDSKQMYPKSKTSGGRKYSFAVDGELVLVKNCYAHSGRHDFVAHARARGPNVFVNCRSENQLSDMGPHERWATGMLFDSIVGNGTLAVENRMLSGSGHGWAGAQIMFWNSTMNKLIVQSPPNHVNWAIGNKAAFITSQGAFVNVPGYTESNNQPVWPPSLYQQQLKDRLGR